MTQDQEHPRDRSHSGRHEDKPGRVEKHPDADAGNRGQERHLGDQGSTHSSGCTVGAPETIRRNTD
jgi:hypothetical protein